MLIPHRRRYLSHLPWGILALVLLVGLWTLRDYGITFDEPIRARSGEDWWRFLFTKDPRYLPEGFLAYYGALFDMLGAALGRVHHRMGGQDDYLARHLLIFMSGWLGLLGTYKLGRLGRRLLPPPAALLALCFLVLVPRYYGACFDNPKDVPFAAAFVWAAYGLVRLLQAPSTRSVLLCGSLAALCTAIRPIGALFIPLGALACLSSPRRGRLLPLQLASTLVLTVALWPMLWVRPPWHLAEAILSFSKHPEGSDHLFLGHVYSAFRPPRFYVAVWIAVTLPLPTLLLAGAGTVAFFTSLRRASRWAAAWGAGLFCLWVLGPMVLPALRRMTLYSTVRHFLFMMPALCLLAALGAWKLFSLLQRPWQRALLILLLALAYGDVALTMARLHPYEALYFNRLQGGLPGATGSFDVAFYGETYREALLWLRAHEKGPIHVNTTGGWRTFDVPAYYAARLGMQFNTPSFDYFVSEVRLHRETHLPGQVIHTISREGVPLAVVVKVAPMAGRHYELPADRPTLGLCAASPREQTVPLYWGYLGSGRLRMGGTVLALPVVQPPLYPAVVRTGVALHEGDNRLVLDLSHIDRAAGLYLHHPADAGLHPCATEN